MASPADYDEAAATAVEAKMKLTVAKGLLDADDHTPAIMMIDFDDLRTRVGTLMGAFDDHFVHCYAVKANPLKGVLDEMVKQGTGCECASLGEVEHSLRAGAAPHKILYDSPCKSVPHLRRALEAGVNINLDCFEEVERTNGLFADGTLPKPVAGQFIGVRINPQIGGGTIASVSTATKTSKFGIPLLDNQAQVMKMFADNPWISMIHCHVGSQGCATQQLVDGARAIVDLSKAVNAARGCGSNQIQAIDIGGGLTTNYASEAEKPTYNEYAAALREQVPEVYSKDFTIFTEFGRSLIVKSGKLITRCEFTKEAGGRKIAVCHVGSNILVRECYLPTVWLHRMTVHTPDGAPKTGVEKVKMDIAGPLCFSGDIIAHLRELPDVVSNDLLCIHDCGGYTIGMYSRYNSMPAPPVYGFSGGETWVMKKAETLDDMLAFWG